MKKIIIISVIIMCSMIMPKEFLAATYEVNLGESIQGAVDQAYPGDTVMIRGGRYYESVTLRRSDGYKQDSKYGWSLGDGEIDGRSYALDEIFNGPGVDAGGDYTLIEGSPAINAGKDVSVLLDSLGITGADPWFPDFDFTKDKAGNSWAETPSMGAYEYAAGIDDPGPEPQPDPEPETNPDPELEDDAANDIPDKTLLRISNNIIKSGGNSVVTINCDVKDAGNLTVKIYDSKGKEIITLWNKHEEPGTVPVTWTGLDASGSKVGSGIYLIHMECGGYKETKKIAVVK